MSRRHGTASHVLVVQHEDAAPPALYRQWLTAAGVALDVRLCHRGDPLPESLSGHSGLLVLGGEMGAYDDTAHPWLTGSKRLVVDAVAAGTPLLGICLGHQLAAVALGGGVASLPGRGPRGVVDVGWAPGAEDDPLLGGLAAAAAAGDGTPAVHWNDDVVVEPPPGSRVLARSPDGSVQVLRLGPVAWGVQLHPEADRGLVARWVEGTPEQVAAPRDAAGLDAIERAEPRLRAAWRGPAERFARLVAAPVPA